MTDRTHRGLLVLILLFLPGSVLGQAREAPPAGVGELGDVAQAVAGCPRFEMLWERQVDSRWRPGDDQENGVTAEFVEFSPDGSLLVTGNGQGEAFILNAVDGAIVRRLVMYTEQDLAEVTDFYMSGGKAKALEVECGYFSADATHVALGGNIQGVKIFRLRDGRLVRRLPVANAEVDGMATAPNGKYFAHADRFSATLVNVEDWRPLQQVSHGSQGAVNSIDFTSDSRFMISAGGFGRVIITRTADGAEIGVCLQEPQSSIKSARFSPDGKFIAAGYGGADRIAVCRFDDRQTVAKRLDFYIEAVAWTADGGFLLAGGRDGRGNMHVFRAGDWRKLGEVTVQKDRCNIEYIDASGDLIAVAGEDSHVRVFRVTQP